jgi:hypothetical protein
MAALSAASAASGGAPVVPSLLPGVAGTPSGVGSDVRRSRSRSRSPRRGGRSRSPVRSGGSSASAPVNTSSYDRRSSGGSSAGYDREHRDRDFDRSGRYNSNPAPRR